MIQLCYNVQITVAKLQSLLEHFHFKIQWDAPQIGSLNPATNRMPSNSSFALFGVLK